MTSNRLEYRREYRKKNRDKINASQREYIRKNREKLNEYQREYVRKNREKVKEYQRNYNKRKKEELKMSDPIFTNETALIFCDANLASIEVGCAMLQIETPQRSQTLIVNAAKAETISRFLKAHPNATTEEILGTMKVYGIEAYTQEVQMIKCYTPSGRIQEILAKHSPNTESKKMSTIAGEELIAADSIIMEEMGGLKAANTALENVRKLIISLGSFERAEQAIKQLDTLKSSTIKKPVKKKADAVAADAVAAETSLVEA